MKPLLWDIDFEPLTTVKARLSEKISNITKKKRPMAITVNGKPEAIIIAYEDFLNWARKVEQSKNAKVIDFKEWEKGSSERRAISKSIKSLFEISSLKKKGRKSYKEDALKKLK